MACQPVPTLTQVITSTGSSASVTVSNVVTSAPPTFQIVFMTSCAAATGTPPVTGNCVVTSSVSTIPGGLTTMQVPVTVDVPVTVLQSMTLYAPCSTTPTQAPPPPTTTTSSTSSTPPPPPPPPTTTFIRSFTTPPPTVITASSSSTLPNGSVVINTVITTSTLQPSSVLVPTSAPVKANTKMGAIVGGAVGGFVGLILIVSLIYWILKRRNKWDDIFENGEEDETSHVRRMRDQARRLDLGSEVDQGFEPKPYQYGLVGTPAPSVSPPSSPTTARIANFRQGYDGYQGYANDGQQWVPEGYVGNGAQPYHNVPSSPGFETPGGQAYSLSPMVPVPAGGYYPRTTNSSRPSSADSSAQRASPMGYYRPPSSQGRATSPTSPTGYSHGRRQSASSGGYYGGIETTPRNPSTGSSGGSGSGVAEEQRRQLNLANPSADMNMRPARMSSVNKGGRRSRSSSGVVVHQDAGRVDHDEGGANRAEAQRRSTEKIQHLYDPDNVGGDGGEGSSRPPPAYSE